MIVRTEGVLRGANVELEEPITVLPEGALVTVEIRPRELPLAEKHRLVRELAGAWASDATLAPIFAEIEDQRHTSLSRLVSFDDPP